jgi:hypothetical protein
MKPGDVVKPSAGEAGFVDIGVAGAFRHNGGNR